MQIEAGGYQVNKEGFRRTETGGYPGKQSVLGRLKQAAIQVNKECSMQIEAGGYPGKQRWFLTY